MMDIKITNAINKFKQLMEANSADNSWCIVGSIALRVLGGVEVNPHDLDVEVLESSEMESIFRNTAIAYGSSFHERKPDGYDAAAEKRMKRPITWKHKPYIFEIRGVRVNVWMVTEFSNRSVQLANGLRYALPADVLDRKLAYGRPKDIQLGLMLIQDISTMMNRHCEECDEKKKEE